MSKVEFKPDTLQGKALATWWQELQERRGDRAELRRAKSPAEAIIHPANIALVTRLRPYFAGHGRWEDRMGMIAGLASHLDHVIPDEVLSVRSLAERMADKEGDAPLVSELRFRRLLQRERDELYRPLIRILRMLKGRASLFDLAESVFFWGDAVRKRWAFDYFPRVPSKQTL